jgi:3-oxoacid CoA-transferase subunit A
VPVNGFIDVGLVIDVDGDWFSLRKSQDGAGDGAVIANRLDRFSSTDFEGDRGNPKFHFVRFGALDRRAISEVCRSGGGEGNEIATIHRPQAYRAKQNNGKLGASGGRGLVSDPLRHIHRLRSRTESGSNGVVRGTEAILNPESDVASARSKVWPSADAALAGIVRDGMLLAIGGFGLCGIPESLIGALHRSGVRGLTIASNNAGVDGWGIGVLLEDHQVAKMISSYVGENAEFERQFLAGELEVEFCPQGTLAERMRAGGAGIPGFYTRTGVGTVVAEGKEQKSFDGITYILERGICADLALVKAWKADTLGNLVYRRTARNFNPNAAMCGKISVAEAEIIVAPGELDPDEIHTPGIFVHRLVHNPFPEKRIEKRTIRAEE